MQCARGGDKYLWLHGQGEGADGKATFQPCIAVCEGHTMVSGFSQRSYKAVIQENIYFNIHFLLMIE